ncbi:hypothetical protein WME89_06355 [Sorangium sp. So ce321]|uniref:hypothetical protein n=1 Tax=Sorangium sp. So ce321 TaxID=3133300 RepID=UPI003F6051FA
MAIRESTRGRAAVQASGAVGVERVEDEHVDAGEPGGEHLEGGHEDSAVEHEGYELGVP